MLRLTVIDAPPDETPPGASKVIGPAGGTIGRTQENTWTLTDEDSLLSRSHFAINFEDGAYVLLDTSTNGSFLNDAREPLGRGNKAPLQDGDTIRIGGYRIAVALESAGAEPPPLAGSTPDFLVSRVPDVDSPEQDSGLSVPEQASEPNNPERLSGFDIEPSPAMNRAEPGPYGMAIEDVAAIPGDDVPAFHGVKPQPLSDGLFGPASKPASAASEPAVSNAGLGDWKNLGGADPQPPGINFDNPDGLLAPAPDYPDSGERGAAGQSTPSADPAKESYALHVPVAEAPPASSAGSDDSAAGGLIPDDWWVEEPASAAPAPTPAPAVAAPPPAPPRPPRLPPEGHGAGQHAVPNGPDDAVADASRPLTPETANASGVETQLRLALRPALGTHADGLSVRDLLQVVEELSAMTHAAIPRMMQALGSRTEFKDQLRLDQTMVRPRDNNPMKFCDTAEEAMQHMLLNDHPGLLGGRQAMDEAFHELATHQAALLGALPAALQETVMHFSPDQVEAATEGEGIGAFALPKGKGKLWDSYRELFAKLAQSDQGTLERIFMKSLARYYERSLGSMK